MIDESFHLTPVDVRRTDFPAAIRGYDKARVDEFRDRVANELERMTRINQELDTKARGFHEQLRAFRERDKALNEALVSAQQLRAETRDQAEREAQLVLREARADGERIVDAARSEVRRLASEIEGLERARRAYLSHLRSMVARQLADLDAIPESTAGPSGGGFGSLTTESMSSASPSTGHHLVGGAQSAAAAGHAGTGSPSSESPVGALSGSAGYVGDDPRAPTPTPAWLNAVPAE